MNIQYIVVVESVNNFPLTTVVNTIGSAHVFCEGNNKHALPITISKSRLIF
jgi:hypothetical protein